MRDLETTLVGLREALAQQSAESAAQSERHRDQITAVNRSIEDQARAREEVTKWLTVLGRKYEWLAKDARDRAPAEPRELPSRASSTPPPTTPRWRRWTGLCA